LRRRAAKVDSNQADIVAALRAIGCSVAVTSAAGDGFTDLVVGDHGNNYLMEVKDGSLPPSKRKLTDDQIEFHGSWKGQICVVHLVAGAIGFITAHRKKDAGRDEIHF
jgi:hypothetical protein